MMRNVIAGKNVWLAIVTAIALPNAVGWHSGLTAQEPTPAQLLQRARVGGSTNVESNINTALRRFEPGNRTYWHSHEGGFILFVHEGRARVQRRGELMKELGPGELDYTPPGVEHWHGAAPNDMFVQLGVVPFGGGIKFLEEVSGAQYDGSSL